MTEIPEHLRRRAAAARDKAEHGNRPDRSLLGDGMRLALYNTTTGVELCAWPNPDLSDPDKRAEFTTRVVGAASRAIRDYNNERLVTDEIDMDGLADSLGADPNELAAALVAVRDTAQDRQ